MNHHCLSLGFLMTALGAGYFYRKELKNCMFKLSLLFKLYKGIKIDAISKENSKFNDYSAIITYDYNGNSYDINIPFNRKYVLPMSDLKVKLILNGKEIDITQQPGIPYLLSAGELGGDKLLIINTASGSTKYYESNECPGYATEMFFSE